MRQTSTSSCKVQTHRDEIRLIDSVLFVFLNLSLTCQSLSFFLFFLSSLTTSFFISIIFPSLFLFCYLFSSLFISWSSPLALSPIALVLTVSIVSTLRMSIRWIIMEMSPGSDFFRSCSDGLTALSLYFITVLWTLSVVL